MNRQLQGIYKTQIRGYFNNGLRSNLVLFDRRHNNLRVISTPEFPVPYYQRITRAPASTEQQTLNFKDLFNLPNEKSRISIQGELSQSAEGLKAIEFVENKVQLDNYSTKIKSAGTQAEIYTDDLINYIDSANDENTKILKQVNLADCFKH